ncbi:hypothetical protein C1I98_33355 [Spongiactinospora gelatinilytica]|uniref:DUF7144 domain-containing protein n=1 Tax=Spongiactinospora gelatinilytica TaxID=2666298 RepID=A0A2W2ESI4_9ACTN|nr:hypothetical protein [Spongiactinospora gelatinilytica]PZG27466.1 hypothetical protein C1I98_33355 [Spongiactinospora gelatinilytica]
MTYQSGHPRQAITGWVGWVWFAGIILIMVGIFNIVSGLYAIVNSDLYVQTPSRLLLFNLAGWGWIHLIFGVLLLATGIALSIGETWARAVATVLVVINAITQLIWLAVNPWWSLVIIAVDVLVLYAIIVHGREAKTLSE